MNEEKKWLVMHYLIILLLTWLCHSYFAVCPCYEKGTTDGSQCHQDTGFCQCKDGFYGNKCLYGKSKCQQKKFYNSRSPPLTAIVYFQKLVLLPWN